MATTRLPSLAARRRRPRASPLPSRLTTSVISSAGLFITELFGGIASLGDKLAAVVTYHVLPSVVLEGQTGAHPPLSPAPVPLLRRWSAAGAWTAVRCTCCRRSCGF